MKKDYHKILTDFYAEHGLMASDFQCKHLEICKKTAEPRPLCTGASAHIGSQYGDPYRIVVVSLDRGHTSFDDSVESRSDLIENIWGSKLNRHMKGTEILLKALLENSFGIEENLFSHYAMTNSAKCCGADGDRTSVSDALYKNCAAFSFEEVRLLKPELLITQGNRAIEIFNNCLIALSASEMEEVLDHLKLLTDEDKENVKNLVTNRIYKVDWVNSSSWLLRLPHPSARGGQWKKFEHTYLKLAVDVIGFLVAKRKG